MDSNINDPHAPEGPQREPGFKNPDDEDRPLADRLGRDPGNIGTDVSDGGDLTYPAPEADTPHM